MRSKTNPWVCLLMVMDLLCTMAWPAWAADNSTTTQITATTQFFLAEAVAKEDVDALLEAGLEVTSAINQQPWFFVALTNQAVMDEISASMTMGAPPVGGGEAPSGEMPTEGEAPADAPTLEEMPEQGDMPAHAAPAADASAMASLGSSPLAIIVDMDENTKSTNADFDGGLACQNMVVAANALGYGTKTCHRLRLHSTEKTTTRFAKRWGLIRP